MNAPFRLAARPVTLDPAEPQQAARIEAFVAAHPDGTPFHRPAWLTAVARGSGNTALVIGLERGSELTAILPLVEVHSPLFGSVMVSSGFAVGGGVLARGRESTEALLAVT